MNINKMGVCCVAEPKRLDAKEETLYAQEEPYILERAANSRANGHLLAEQDAAFEAEARKLESANGQVTVSAVLR